MWEKRIEAQVIGPGSPGHVQVRIGKRVREVGIEYLPATLRIPNAQFVAVVEGGEFLRVESFGQSWLVIQDRVRAVLNAEWDPIGVAEIVADEYDGYIGDIYSMLRRSASPEELAAYLFQVETDAIGLTGLSEEHRLGVAERLLALVLPSL